MSGNLENDFQTSFNPPDRRDNFNVTLFRAFMKADKDNMKILSANFPEHNLIFARWKEFGVEAGDRSILHNT